MKKFLWYLFFTFPIISMDGDDMKRSASARILSELADLEGQGAGVGEEIDKLSKRAAALQKMVRAIGSDTEGLGPRVREIEKKIDILYRDIASIREFQFSEFQALRAANREISDQISTISDDRYTASVAAIASVCVAVIPHIIHLCNTYNTDEGTL